MDLLVILRNNFVAQSSRRCRAWEGRGGSIPGCDFANDGIEGTKVIVAEGTGIEGVIPSDWPANSKELGLSTARDPSRVGETECAGFSSVYITNGKGHKGLDIVRSIILEKEVSEAIEA